MKKLSRKPTAADSEGELQALALKRIADAYARAVRAVADLQDVTWTEGLRISDVEAQLAEAFAKLAKLAVSGLMMHPNGKREERDLIAVEELTAAALRFLCARNGNDSARLRRAAASIHGRDSTRGEADVCVALARLVKDALFQMKHIDKMTARLRKEAASEASINGAREEYIRGASEALVQRIALLGGRQLDPNYASKQLERWSSSTAPGKLGLAGVVAGLASESRLIVRPRTTKQEKAIIRKISAAITKAGLSAEPERWCRPDGTGPWASRGFAAERLSWAGREKHASTHRILNTARSRPRPN